MTLDSLFIVGDESAHLVQGTYDLSLVSLSLFVAVLAGVMAIQLAGMARAEVRRAQRQIFLVSGKFDRFVASLPAVLEIRTRYAEA